MKSISIKILKIMLLVVIGICLFSIASKVSAMHIEVVSGKAGLTKGETCTLVAYDEEHNKVSCGWSSSRTAVATVINGRVTAKGEGSTVITAKSLTSDDEATITVTVIDNGASDDIELENDSGEIDIAGTINVVAQIVSFIFNIIKTFILPLLTSLTM